ncbi:hypothetical protein B566_EDAN002127 [Ephemera danica]|nr:hypothetical protein B566_EDAN002127 [Ephemera danica]
MPNFMTLVHPSRHIATTTVKPQPTSNCNETQNLLNLALSRENAIQGKLDLTQHRENELAAKLDTEIRHRTKAEQRFEFAHEREKELSNKLLSCNVEMLETRTRLHLLDSLQNYTDKRLKESQQLIDETNSKMIKFLQEKAESDLQFKLTIENLNLTNIQLRQKQADLSTRTDEVLKENAEIRSRFDRTQKYAAEASSKLEEYQRKHAATLSLLTNVNEKVADLTMKMEAAQEMEKRCQLDLSRQESEFKSVKARDEKQRILDKMNNCTLLLQRVASKFPKLTLNQTDANLQKQLKRLLNKMIELSTGIYLFVDTSKSWSEARAFCQAQGMDLVAIESEEEDKALVAHAKSLGGELNRLTL